MIVHFEIAENVTILARIIGASDTEDGRRFTLLDEKNVVHEQVTAEVLHPAYSIKNVYEDTE